MSPKTKPNDADVKAFLEASEPERRRLDGLALLDIFDRATAWQPKMWGSSIIGYGTYDYTYKTGNSGTWMATGFSPRKSALSIYIMPGYQNYSDILGRLGKHKIGKSCLYVNKLADIDEAVLIELIQTGIKDLANIWPVSAG